VVAPGWCEVILSIAVSTDHNGILDATLVLVHFTRSAKEIYRLQMFADRRWLA
jgi:hypothetical protein